MALGLSPLPQMYIRFNSAHKSFETIRTCFSGYSIDTERIFYKTSIFCEKNDVCDENENFDRTRAYMNLRNHAPGKTKRENKSVKTYKRVFYGYAGVWKAAIFQPLLRAYPGTVIRVMHATAFRCFSSLDGLFVAVIMSSA